MESQEIEVKGIGKINRADWMLVLSMDDTVLLTRINNQNSPKLWLTVDEWEGRPTIEDLQPTVKFEKEPPTKFKNFQEASEAFLKLKEEKEAKKEEKRVDMSTIPVEELDKMRINELFTLAVFTQGEEIVRDKLYCALGHCQTGCKSCKKDE